MAKNKDLEHLEQIQVIQWARECEAAGNLPGIESLYAIPNGGRRHISTAVKLKNEGVKAGMPDLHLPVSRGIFHSLYVEMKIPGGCVSPEQLDIHTMLKSHGNEVFIAWDAGEAKRALFNYLTKGRI